MNLPIHKPRFENVKKHICRKRLALLSLFALLSSLALVAVSIGVLATTYYGTPITINNPTLPDSAGFGASVAIDGEKFIVGAFYDDTVAVDAGSAYLYDATTGALLQNFNNPTPEYGDLFGNSVSISGDKVLIGAYGDDTGAINAGSAYLYNASTGALLRTFNNPTPAASDLFGYSVSISGDKVLIGAAWEDTGATDAGSAYLVDAITGALLQTFNNPTPTHSGRFGSSVSILGDKVLIGANGEDTGAMDAGSAYLYDATTGALLKTFNNPTPAVGDLFGHSVSISGDNVLIGAHYDDTVAINAGSAYLYLLQIDTDDDGIVDGADNCPADDNTDQTDTDGDGQGNSCDPTPYGGDPDNDGIGELLDNCLNVYNPDQQDTDSDGIGNVCDPTPNGDPNPDPTSIDQCKNLGWMDFGFRNQGQCVTFVNTGHYSR